MQRLLTLIFHLFIYSKKKLRLKIPKKVILIGDEIAVDAAHQILKPYLTNAIFNYVLSYQQINIHELKADEIIFCVGGNFSYYQAIILLQKIKNHIPVKWFYINSKNIAGSSNKNKAGEIYTAAQP